MKKLSSLMLASILGVATFAGVLTNKKTKVQPVKAEGEVFTIGDHNMITEHSFSGDSGTVTYEETLDGDVVTFNNFEYSHTGSDISSGGDGTVYSIFYYNIDRELTINIIGNNTITQTDKSGVKFAIAFCLDSYTSVNFTGDGTLTVTSAKATLESAAFETGTGKSGLVNFNGPTLNFYAGNVTVSSDAHAGSVGFNGGNQCNITLNSGTINAFGAHAIKRSCGASFDGKLTINGGDFNATSGTSDNDKAYGLNVPRFSTFTFGPDAGSLTAIGESRAVLSDGTVKLYRGGFGWSDTAGTLNQTEISAGTSVEISSTIKKVFLGGIKASVTGFTGDYDGLSHSINVDVTIPSSGYTVTYGTSSGSYPLSTSPSYEEPGTYTVYYRIVADPSIGYPEVTGSQTISINKLNPSLTAPVLVSDFDFDNTSHAICSSGSVTGGTINYSVGSTPSAWDTYVPTAKMAGNYTVWYKVVGDSNHNDIDPVCLGTVHINSLDFTDVDVHQTGTLTYTGTSQTATVSASATAQYGQSPITFKYSTSSIGPWSEDVPSFTTAGSHTAYYQILAPNHNETIGSFIISIGKADSTLVAPTGKTNLVYTGEEQNLLNSVGLATGGQIYYKVDDGAYSPAPPKATTAGNHTVYYKVVGDANHNDYPEGSLVVNIAKADPTISVTPAAIENLHFSGAAQMLISAGTASGGTLQYKVGDGEYSTSLPKATNVGTYIIYYKVAGDSNHNDIAEESFTVSIAENDKTGLTNTKNTVNEYLSSIEERYPDIASDLQAVIDEANACLEDPNQTSEQIEAKIAALNNALSTAEVDVVIAKIDAIGVVSYSAESKAKIDAALAAYNALTSTQQPAVSNVSTLLTAKTNYDAADVVVTQIDSIGTVTYSQECSDRIEKANELYDALTVEQQALVSNYDVLEQAQTDWYSVSGYHAGAVPVMNLIDDIGVVEDTSACESKINMARAFYNASSANVKSYVENYDVLVAAEEMYANLHAKNIVEGYISDIGEVTFTAESKEKIDTARSAYEALTGPQKDLMTNYDVLLAAEAAYASFVNDDIAKSHVETLINAIGTVHYDEDTVARISAARTAYNALTYGQRLLVSNYGVLEQAEIDYNFYYMDHQFSDPVEVLISEIGAVEYTDECKTKIDEVRDAYDALFVEQKELVSNYSVLLEAEHAYSNLEAANAVEVLVSSIGVVAYNQTSKEKIDAARAAYETLPGEQKDLVSNYSTLIAAETMYASLEENDYLRIYVESLIDAIGAVQYDGGTSARIAAARDAYDDLTTTQKALVSNYEILTNAESAYASLVANHAVADPVVDLIANIGDVEYTSASKTKIDGARAAYDALSAEQKALVSNYSVLTTAESTYNHMKTNVDSANAVEILISSIGDVTYTTDSKTKINAAREAYNALTAEQKELVSNYSVLVNGESSYSTLEANHNAASKVETAISSIGTVEYSDQSKAKIDEARWAYNQLSDEQKALVGNYNDLTTAETTYASLVPASTPASTEAGLPVWAYIVIAGGAIVLAGSAFMLGRRKKRQ